jgi:DNA polymerase bacteriophage-type
MGDRDAGATFAIDDLGFIDFETRSATEIDAGAVRYATEASAIILAWAIGLGPVNTVHLSAFDGWATLEWSQVPDELKRFHYRVVSGQAHWAAWNAGFDKAVWNFSTLGFPVLEPEHIIDPMVQAAAAGLPPDLSMAAKMSGSPYHKDASGTGLLRLFCLPPQPPRPEPKKVSTQNKTPLQLAIAAALRSHAGTATPQSHPELYQHLLRYAGADIEAMRGVFQRTRQLPLAEWKEYWAMERINERGAAIDVDMVRSAAILAAQDRDASRSELSRLTNGAVHSVDQVKVITEWLLARLPAEGREILTKREEEIDEDGEIVRPAKFALTRRRVERLIAYISNTQPELDNTLRVLLIRLYGGAKTPLKFAKMLNQQVDGILYGQYVFNGAGQTGRASSRGVQVHNLARDTLDNEPELIDLLLNGHDYRAFASNGDDPVARKLSLLIRPAFVPRNDRVFVWSDWSQIEARVLPWLCDHLAGSRTRLEIFRAVDADPSIPDIYTRTAANLSHIEIAAVTKAIRQRGKVAELALGFCGGVGALQAMAAGYGRHLNDVEAREIVDRWRAANPWVNVFSRELWDAATMARNVPHLFVPAGRVGFIFLPEYLGGSLLCQLPSGRWLTYRALRMETVDVLDDDDKPTGEKRRELMFARNYGRVKLWPGLFMENITQATAADFLRGTLVRLENEHHDTRLHTHDEILLEVPASVAAPISVALREVMQRGFAWSKGLPLMSEETIAYYYSKHEGSHGL